jgi:hypothetical protein
MPLTPAQQRNFVKDLTASIRDSVVNAISAGNVPAEWDGHELRCYLADRFEQDAKMSAIRKEPRSRRAREYRNTIQTSSTL